MWWLSILASGALLILLSRWALRAAKPRDDIRMTERALEHVGAWVTGGWTILWRAYGPITAETRAAWERLRGRYQGGSFGTEGT